LVRVCVCFVPGFSFPALFFAIRGGPPPPFWRENPMGSGQRAAGTRGARACIFACIFVVLYKPLVQRSKGTRDGWGPMLGRPASKKQENTGSRPSERLFPPLGGGHQSLGAPHVSATMTSDGPPLGEPTPPRPRFLGRDRGALGRGNLWRRRAASLETPSGII